MISRTWHGRVPQSRADAYVEILHRTGFADFRATPGYRGVVALRRDEGAVTHIELTSFWESLESIRRFAGPELERARYYEEDDEFLLEKEPFVVHSEVFELDPPGGVPPESKRRS